MAGRCASCDRTVHGTVRVMPAAAMMGQAAGTAAVQSLRTGQPAADLDTAQLVRTLREDGACLPQGELSKEMTRA
ncbi:MAG: FAD-dependent oxidoreductase [Candidatus Brocadiia bacterium]